jgi:hypothetical protein
MSPLTRRASHFRPLVAGHVQHLSTGNGRCEAASSVGASRVCLVPVRCRSSVKRMPTFQLRQTSWTVGVERYANGHIDSRMHYKYSSIVQLCQRDKTLTRHYYVGRLVAMYVVVPGSASLLPSLA